MKVGLQTWVLSSYRAEFMNMLGSSLSGNFSVFAGAPRSGDALDVTKELRTGKLIRGRNINLFNGPFYMCVQPGLLKWLYQFDHDALILGANPRFLTNWVAAMWMRRRKRLVLGWGLWAPTRRGCMNSFSKMVWRVYTKQFDAFIMYSSKDAEECRQLGVPASRIFVAPNAILPAPPVWPDRPPPEGRIRVLFVGRLEARKKVGLLIHACAIVHPQPELWIVGDGPDRNDLERLAAQVHPGTRFWGAQFGSLLGELFRQSDLFVLPGTGGLAVQQAMYYALPVVVAEADGTQSDLVTSENGWLLPPGDGKRLSAILQEAADRPSILRKMGSESWKIVRNRVNLDIMLEAFLKALGVKSS